MVPGQETLELKKQLETLTTEKAKIDERAEMLDKNFENAKIELAKQTEEIKIITGELSGKKAEYSALNEKLVQQKADIENMRDKLSMEFKNIANKIFEEKIKLSATKAKPALI